jgi:hypothetical protein
LCRSTSEHRQLPHHHPFTRARQSTGKPHPPSVPRVSTALLPDPPCPVSPPHLRATLDADLLIGWFTVARRRPRRSGRAYGPAQRWFGPPGHVTKPTCSHDVGQAWGRPRVCEPGHVQKIDGISFSFFIFNSIQVQTSKIHIYLNIGPKFMKPILLDS